MRLLIAPDCFGGTLTAVEASAAIAAGWARARPQDELVQSPLSDGGPGFLAVLQAAIGGVRQPLTVRDPRGRPVPAHLLRLDQSAYLESAQACGLHLLRREEQDPAVAGTGGVGELMLAALDSGASRIVVGLGGSASNDGGAGLLRSLGLTPVDAAGRALPAGGAALLQVAALVGTVDPRLAGARLIAACDVTAPLLGPTGASCAFAGQKGADADGTRQLERALGRWAGVLEDHAGVAVRDEPGSGAAGGLGAALAALGAVRVPGIDLVGSLLHLDDLVAGVDLVLTGEGQLDRGSAAGKVVGGVAARAAAHGVPCVALAGQVRLSTAEAAALGLAATFSMRDQVGLEVALGAPRASLQALTARVARQWGADMGQWKSRSGLPVEPGEPRLSGEHR